MSTAAADAPLVIKAPGSLAPLDAEGAVSVFLAGSIEMGRAVDWQSQVTAGLAGVPGAVVLNPRRDDWDSSWKQSIDDPRFTEQVEWELTGLERATVVALYLAPGTISPISLLELGLFSRSGRMVVCCPDGFHRKGNVDVVCRRYGVPTVPTLEALVAAVRDKLTAARSRGGAGAAGDRDASGTAGSAAAAPASDPAAAGAAVGSS